MQTPPTHLAAVLNQGEAHTGGDPEPGRTRHVAGADAHPAGDDSRMTIEVGRQVGGHDAGVAGGEPRAPRPAVEYRPGGPTTVKAIEPRRLRSRDGTRLTYYTGGVEEGVALVFCGGLGGGIRVWQPLIERFAPHFRLLAWDYRGLYASGPSRRRAYGIEQHARDLLQLLDHEGIEAPVLLGWSMGVQVMLEAHRANPALARGFVAIHGTPGRPLQTAFGSDVIERIFPPISLVMRAAGRRLASRAPSLARSRLVAGTFVWASQRLGWMAPGIDLERFQDVAAEWLGLDLGIYAETFRRMGEHDASDLLATIRAPALIIAGERDRFTPSETAREMAGAMPAARLELLPGATHFGLIEYPDDIVGAVQRYLSETIRVPAPRPDEDPPLPLGARAPESAPPPAHSRRRG